MSASYSVFTSPNHAPIPNHLPTLIVTPHGQPHHTLYSYIHTNMNKETYLLTPSPQGDLCVAKMVPPPGSRGPGGPGDIRSDPGHSAGDAKDRSVRCEASRNLKWSITNTGINAPVYKLTLPNPDAPGHEQPLFQISKPNPNAPYWTMFYFTYAGHLIPPKRIEFGKIQKNAAQGSGGGGGTKVTISGKTPEEKAVWQTLGEGNEDMVEWIVLCAALNVLDEEIIKAAAAQAPPVSAGRRAATATSPVVASGGALGSRSAVPSSRPSVSPRVGNGNPAISPRHQMPAPMPSAARAPPLPQQPTRQPVQAMPQPQHQPQPQPLRGPPNAVRGPIMAPPPQQQYAPPYIQSRPSPAPSPMPMPVPARGNPPTQYSNQYRASPSPQMQPPRSSPVQGYSSSAAVGRPLGPPTGRSGGGGIIMNSPQAGYGGDGFGGGGGGSYNPQVNVNSGGRRF